MLIWLDDERDPKDFSDREGWVWVKTAHEAKDLLVANPNFVECLSLDHDLGPEENGTGYDVALFLEMMAVYGDHHLLPHAIQIHSANPVGRKNMQAAIDSIDRHRKLFEQSLSVAGA